MLTHLSLIGLKVKIGGKRPQQDAGAQTALKSKAPKRTARNKRKATDDDYEYDQDAQAEVRPNLIEYSEPVQLQHGPSIPATAQPDRSSSIWIIDNVMHAMFASGNAASGRSPLDLPQCRVSLMLTWDLRVMQIPIGAEVVGVGADDLEEMSDEETAFPYQAGPEPETYKDYSALSLKDDHSNRYGEIACSQLVVEYPVAPCRSPLVIPCVVTS